MKTSHKYISMANTYFVGFLQGTSGRFISSIMWSLLNDLDTPIPFSNFNSAHIESFSVLNWKIDNIPDPTWNEECYKLIEFTESATNLNPNKICLFYSHVYPDFDTIFARFSEAKVVVIGIDEADYMEIAGNYLFKNAIEKTCFTDILPHRVKVLYKILYNRECEDSHIFSEDEIYDIIHLYQKNMRSMPYAIEYTEARIPREFSQNVLLLKYSDLYRKDDNENYIGYEKLKQFTNCNGNETIEDNYKNYVLGRDKFLSTHLHWIKNEQIRTNTTLVP